MGGGEEIVQRQDENQSKAKWGLEKKVKKERTESKSKRKVFRQRPKLSDVIRLGVVARGRGWERSYMGMQSKRPGTKKRLEKDGRNGVLGEGTGCGGNEKSGRKYEKGISWEGGQQGGG